jgi:hypothetical protein
MDRSLAPGFRVLHRDREHCQVGLDRTRAVAVPARLARDADALLADPLVSHLVVDPDRLPTTPIDARDRAALVQRDPQRAAERLRRRAATRVQLLGSLAVDAEPLLDATGLRRTSRDPDVVLAMYAGEADRAALDELVRHLVPHLVVRLVDGVVTLGPFVVPGRTACLRCLDAHLALEDPAHPALVAQHAQLAEQPEDGWAPPRDLPLLALATGWAVRDVVTHAEGDRPTTWSATIRLEPGLAAVTDTQWLRHPECGCWWLEPSATMAT